MDKKRKITYRNSLYYCSEQLFMYVLFFIFKFGFSRKYGGDGKHFVTYYKFCYYAILYTKKAT